MLELTNLTNHETDAKIILHNSKKTLEDFLNRHHLDGLELMACEPLDENLLPRKWIHGSHLLFFPVWLSFWTKNKEKLAREIGDDEQVREYFLTNDVDEWIAFWQKNISYSVQAGAKYVVFHATETPVLELFSRKFSLTNEEVIDQIILLVNRLMKNCLPENVTLLFENLWWVGLTLREKKLAEKLLAGVSHKNTGFMLDTGHLMCTNLDLIDEKDSVDFVVKCMRDLGELSKKIYGVHLHQSQSGKYVKEMMQKDMSNADAWTMLKYIARVDYHAPFQTPYVQKIFDVIQPKYLVHEFLHKDMQDWDEKIFTQRRALGLE